MAIELKQGLGKDGSPTIPYVRAHPTNYVWRDDIERLTRGLVNREAFERRIPLDPRTPSGVTAIEPRSTCGASGVAGTRYPRGSGTECMTRYSMTLTLRTSGGSSGRAKYGTASTSARGGGISLGGPEPRTWATSTTYT